jgi:Flp pilus assembly protein TadG
MPAMGGPNGMGENMKTAAARVGAFLRDFARARRGNIAMIFAICLVPLTITAGVGLDYARGMVVHSQMSEALDAAALAIGSTSGLTQSQAQNLASQYFTANYKGDPSYGTPTLNPIVYNSNGSVTVSATDSMPVTLLKAVGVSPVTVGASSTVVWGQNKLWVALVLDNSGSMAQNGKMSALQSASKQLLTTLQGASSTPGDVEVAVVPFTNDVNAGTAINTSYIDWTNWSAQGAADLPATTAGPGDNCTSGYSYGCRSPGTNTQMSSSATIPTSGSTKGYICPWSYSSSSYTNGTNGHYFMGCFTSVAASGTTVISTGSSASCTGYSSSNCSCKNSGNSKTCSTKNWTHPAWVAETNHALWNGCFTDRTQSYDIQNTQPSGSTSGFEADNNDNCPAATITILGYNWTSLASQITAMQAAGSTNQAIGVAHGWQALTPGNPYGTPAVPASTTRYIILLSDGLNTQDRWYGNGMTESTTLDGNIDSREEKTCDAAKADGVVIYALYVNINGSDGDSAPLQYCASDSSKYFVLTSSSQIATDFATIAQQITNLRVSK